MQYVSGFQDGWLGGSQTAQMIFYCKLMLEAAGGTVVRKNISDFPSAKTGPKRMFIHWGNHANKRLARTGSHFAGRAPKARRAIVWIAHLFGYLCVWVIGVPVCVCACARGQEKILELVDSANKRPAFQHNHACSALTRPHHWRCFSLQVALLVVFCKVYPMDDGIFLSTSLPLALFLGLLLCHLSTSQRTSRSSVFLASLASAPLVDIHSIVEEFFFTVHFPFPLYTVWVAFNVSRNRSSRVRACDYVLSSSLHNYKYQLI